MVPYEPPGTPLEDGTLGGRDTPKKYHPKISKLRIQDEPFFIRAS